MYNIEGLFGRILNISKTLFRRFLRDLEGRRTLHRIPSAWKLTKQCLTGLDHTNNAPGLSQDSEDACGGRAST